MRISDKQQVVVKHKYAPCSIWDILMLNNDSLFYLKSVLIWHPLLIDLYRPFFKVIIEFVIRLLLFYILATRHMGS